MLIITASKLIFDLTFFLNNILFKMIQTYQINWKYLD